MQNKRERKLKNRRKKKTIKSKNKNKLPATKAAKKKIAKCAI